MPMMTKEGVIKEKELVIVQKGNYFKACRVARNRPQKFGRYGEGQTLINLENGIGHLFGTTFKLARGSKRIFDLELHEEDGADGLDLEIESGLDNRHIVDDGRSQALSKTDIQNLVDTGVKGDQVIQTLAQNSSTFKSKTKYSQEKYVTKKLKKYDELLTLHRPSVRLLAHMYYSQDPLKISNLRIDSLSQLVSYVNVRSGGSYAVYEGGVQGLVSAAVLERVGAGGKVVHVYSGACPHREAVELMGFEGEELKALSFLGAENLPLPCGEGGEKEEANGLPEESPAGEEEEKEEETNNPGRHRKFVRSRLEDIRVSRGVLSRGVHGVIVACRQHPANVALALISYLRSGHSFAVFSPYKEPLMDLFVDLKTEQCVNVRLSETWLRNYQVLPQRTHPEVNMSGGGGYVLAGWKVGK